LLAIALVVDDAIVVVEDCSRIVDKGLLNRRQAAEKAMRELQGPIVGEVLVLMSVFIPTAFVSGITGQLYKQFALTIAVSTAFSGFNALTLTPALCALFLTPRKNSKFFIYVWFNKFWAKVVNLYERIVNMMLGKPVASMLVFLAIAAVAFWGYISWPSSYIPEEDMGYFMTSVQLPPGASVERTEKVVDGLAAEIKKIPYVKDVMAMSGFSMMGGGASSNMGSMIVVLEPWSKRGKKGNINNVIDMVDELSAKQQEAIVFSVNPPAIQGLGESSGLQMQLLDINSLGTAEMMKALQEIQLKAQSDPRIKSVTTLEQGLVPQYAVKIDRDRVELQGINLQQVYDVLSSYLGSSYVNDFVDFGRTFQVTMQGDAASRKTANDIIKLSVPNSQGEMVPFSTFCSIEPTMGEPSVSRYNMYQTVSLTATPAKGVSSSEGIKAMEEIVK
ncbi:MAG: efflux RND transporter permease subunit, partial [Muribaculaceae bacterium]|nr:efflux RND transporter permease subunit [Muribaculaceae bacterium]